jgi:hypothetical protein
MQPRPNKFDKRKFEIACDFGTAVNIADGLIETLDTLRPITIKDPDEKETKAPDQTGETDQQP